MRENAGNHQSESDFGNGGHAGGLRRNAFLNHADAETGGNVRSAKQIAIIYQYDTHDDEDVFHDHRESRHELFAQQHLETDRRSPNRL